MGTYKQGIYGPYSGRVGNVIGSFWKGRCIMRIRAASFTDANTIPQQIQRMKWKLVSAFVKANSKLVRLGFGAADATLTAFNSAMKFNIPEAITGTFPELKLELSQATLAMGNLLPVEGALMSSTVANTLQVDWADNTNNVDAFEDDNLMIAVIDTATGEVMHFNGYSRMDETATLTLSENWASRTVNAIGFFLKAGLTEVNSRDQVSNSVFMGSATVA